MSLTALNDSAGKPVDWWFIYKLPHGVKCPDLNQKGRVTCGFEYLYLDSESSSLLSISPNLLNSSKGALYETLKQVCFDSPENIGKIFYNDEIPVTEKADGRKGHSKGVLAFNPDDDSAFWLLHSTPRFPLTNQPGFPEDEHIYGQTFLCISLKDVKTASMIARQMYHQQEPLIYECHIPRSVSKNDWLSRLSRGVNVNEKDEPCNIPFSSKDGQMFHLIAKNRHWGKDFWIDLVGPELHVDLNVESWRRGKLPDTEDSDKKHDVDDVQTVNLSALGLDYKWHYTRDHSKWAVSQESDWVCIADINRQISQEKRGGGAICFQNKLLWKSLSQIEILN